LWKVGCSAKHSPTFKEAFPSVSGITGELHLRMCPTKAIQVHLEVLLLILCWHLLLAYILHLHLEIFVKESLFVTFRQVHPAPVVQIQENPPRSFSFNSPV